MSFNLIARRAGSVFSPLNLCRFLLVLHAAGLFFSPPLANLAELLLWLSFVSVSGLRSSFLNFFKTRVGRFFLIFLIFLLIGIVVAALRGSADYSQVWSWRKIFIFPIAAVLFAGDEAGRWRFASWYVAIATFFSIFAIGSFFYGMGGTVARNGSTQSVLFALAAVTSGLCAIMSVNLRRKLLFVLCLLTCFFGLVLVTSGRSGYLGLAVMLLALPIFFVSRYSLYTRVLAIALLISVFAGSLYVSPIAKSRINQALIEFQAPLSEGEETSMGQRKIFWLNTLDMVPTYWLLGSGLTGFGHAYSEHMTSKSDKNFLPTIDPHNQFLKILVEQGIFGLGVFLVLLIALIQLGSVSASAALGASALLAWIATSFFSAHFTTFVEGRLIWLWLGVFLASQSTQSK